MKPWVLLGQTRTPEGEEWSKSAMSPPPSARNPATSMPVLLDVDNGPTALTASHNAGLYDDRGLALARDALNRGGVLASWSSRDDRRFEQRLRHAGFDVTVERVRGRLKKGGPRHTIFLGTAAPGR